MNGSKVDLILKELMERYPVLMPVKRTFLRHMKFSGMPFAGWNASHSRNGGSCADSEHIVGN